METPDGSRKCSLALDRLKVHTEESNQCLPAWAQSAVELGVWARQAADMIGGRLLICCVVPCRASFASLVGLGATAAGGQLFRRGFTWQDLMKLDAGTEIFWSAPGIKQKLAGALEEHEESFGDVMVPVTITEGPKKWKESRSRWIFNESKFRECVFSEEKLPSLSASEDFERARRFFGAIGVSPESSWLMTAGAEVRFVGSRAAFMRGLEGWSLTSTQDGSASSIDELLLLRDEGDPSLAKARFSHLNGQIGASCPVSILDGPLALFRLPEIDTGSLVVVLERTELAEEHLDLLIHAGHERSAEDESKIANLAPRTLSDTTEVWACCLAGH